MLAQAGIANDSAQRDPLSKPMASWSARTNWRILWAMIIGAQPCDEAKAFQPTAASAAKRLKHLQNQANSLGMKLVPA